jgi:hypothetical protein
VPAAAAEISNSNSTYFHHISQLVWLKQKMFYNASPIPKSPWSAQSNDHTPHPQADTDRHRHQILLIACMSVDLTLQATCTPYEQPLCTISLLPSLTYMLIAGLQSTKKSDLKKPISTICSPTCLPPLSKAWQFHWQLDFSLPMKLVWEWLSLLAFVECVYVVPIASCTNTHFHLWNSELAHCICASYWTPSQASVLNAHHISNTSNEVEVNVHKALGSNPQQLICLCADACLL